MEQPEQSNAEVKPDNRVDSAFMYENPSSDTVQPEPTITQSNRNEIPQTEEATLVAEAQDDVSEKDDPNRIAYWQSQADKAKNEAYIMAQEADKYRQQVQQVQKPSVSNESQNRLRSNSLEAPEAPEKPISYNEVDAYNDPESESFKHRIQYDKYRDARVDHLQKQELVRQKQFENQFAKQQETQMVSNAYSQVQNTYGWNQMKAADFIGWAKNPANITLDSLAKLYDISISPGVQQQQVEQKKQAMKNQNEALKVPVTTAVTPGISQPQMDDEALFNEALLTKSYKRRK
tara:strand:- start:2157 stop:3026 length:870 start_codon:yes stop_codon:yes gene_type:complete